MRGNITSAAAVLAIGLVAGGALVAGGVGLALDRPTARFESALRDHARSTARAGTEAAGRMIAQPSITMTSPIAVEQPVRIAARARTGRCR